MRIFKRGWGPKECSFFPIFLFLSYGYCLSLKLGRFDLSPVFSQSSININDRGAFKGRAMDLSITPRATFRAHFWRSSPSPMCDFRIQMETSKTTSRCLVFELQNTWKEQRLAEPANYNLTYIQKQLRVKNRDGMILFQAQLRYCSV